MPGPLPSARRADRSTSARSRTDKPHSRRTSAMGAELSSRSNASTHSASEYVIPNSKAREPTTTAESPCRSASSLTRRDLPMPGSPVTSTTRNAPARASATCSSSTASSASRPTRDSRCGMPVKVRSGGCVIGAALAPGVSCRTPPAPHAAGSAAAETHLSTPPGRPDLARETPPLLPTYQAVVNPGRTTCGDGVKTTVARESPLGWVSRPWSPHPDRYASPRIKARSGAV